MVAIAAVGATVALTARTLLVSLIASGAAASTSYAATIAPLAVDVSKVTSRNSNPRTTSERPIQSSIHAVGIEGRRAETRGHALLQALMRSPPRAGDEWPVP